MYYPVWQCVFHSKLNSIPHDGCVGMFCSEWRKYFHQQSHHRKEGIKTLSKRLHSSKSLVGSKSYPMGCTSLSPLFCRRSWLTIPNNGLLLRSSTTAQQFAHGIVVQLCCSAQQFQIARKSMGKTRVKSARSGIVVQLCCFAPFCCACYRVTKIAAVQKSQLR